MAIKFLNTVAVDTDVLYVDASSNNVGIGTTSPSTALDVYGTSDTYLTVRNSGGGYNAGIRMYGGGAGISHIWHDDTETNPPGIRFGTSANTATTPTTQMYIKGSDGNVGIGTTSPGKKLHVAGDTQIDASGSGQTLLLGRANGQPTIKAQTDNGGHMIIDSTTNFMSLNHYVNKNVIMVAGGGNVGIGTTSPGAKLQVVTSSSGQEGIVINNSNGIQTFQLGHLTSNDSYFQMKNNSDVTEVLFRTDNGNSYINTGNVGIGTTSPSQRTVISGPSTNPLLNTTVPSSATLLLSNSDTAYGTYFCSLGTGTGLIQQRRQTSAVYYDLAINPYGGNVGIGTTSPATIFHISDATTPEVRIQDTTNNRYLSLYQNDSNSYIQSSLNSALVLSTHGANERMRITTAGNVGIGTTSPSQKLEVAGKLLVDNGDLGSVAGDTIYHAEITGTRHHLDFKEVRTANGSDWPNTTYKLQMRVDSTNHQSIDFVSDANSKEHIDIYTGNQIFNTRFDANGNVGIGTTSPQQKLHVAGNGRFESGATGLGGYVTVGNPQETAGNYSAYFFGNTIHDNIYMKGAIAYETLSTTNGRGDMHFLQNSAANGTNASISDSVMTILNDGNVGIGTASPQDLLHLSADSPVLRLTNTVDTGKSSIEFWDNQSGTSQAGEVFYDDNSNLFGLQGNGNGIVFRANNTFPGSELMRLNGSGNLGIGTTSPDSILHVKNGDAGVTPYSLGTGLNIEGTTSTVGINIISSDTAQGRIYFASPSSNTAGAIEYNHNASLSSGFMKFRTGNSERMRITGDGNVGIGTTDPSSLLHIKGADPILTIQDTSTSTSNASSTLRLGESGVGGVLDVYWDIKQASDNLNTHLEINHSSNGNHFTILDNGNVGIGTTSPGDKLEVSGNVYAHAFNSTGTLSRYNGSGGIAISGLAGNAYAFISAYSNSGGAGKNLSLQKDGGNVGIGTTSPEQKLTVSGGINAGGKITYSKSYSSLDTTGNAVAGLTTGFNGNSAGFTFTCFGHGGYQKVVYSCYNVSGTWNTIKVIDEGTNAFDVEASANGTTITFTFKSTSGTKSYTPRVTVEATGNAINNTYA